MPGNRQYRHLKRSHAPIASAWPPKKAFDIMIDGDDDLRKLLLEDRRRV